MKIPAVVRRHLRRRRVYLQLVAIIIEFLRRMLGTLHLNRLDIQLTYGDGDPARTGMIKGFSEAFAGLARSRSRAVRIHLSPIFGKQEITADAEVEVKIRPSTVMLALMRTGWSALRKPALRRFALQYARKSVRDLFHDETLIEKEG